MAWPLIHSILIAQAGADAAAANGGMTLPVKLAITVAVVFGSFALGGLIARSLRMKDYSFRIGLLLFTLIASIVVNIAGWPPKLGIDLRGGKVLIYEVETDTAQRASLQMVVAQVNDRLKARGEPWTAEIKNGKLEVSVPPDTSPDKVRNSIERLDFPDFTLHAEGSHTIDGRTVLTYSVKQAQKAVDMDKMIAAVSRRINPSGVKELTIRQYGKDQLEVIIPEVEEQEVEQIKKKISTSGLLEFRIVANPDVDREVIAAAERTPGRDVIIGGQLRGRWVKADPSLDTHKAVIRETDRGREILVLIDRFNVDGRYLRRAAPGYDQGQLAVNFSFDAQGAQLFGALTSNNLPDPATGLERRLGIILDNTMLSAPTIRSTIRGEGQITGRFTQQDVDFLVGVLNAGSLPASLRPEPISEQQISAQLGDDTIRAGSTAMIMSTVAILVFMLVYYRFAGMVADIAVMLNVIVTVALMIMIKAAFTLPGLAGLVLTVGMAVDANVLIYERMREESHRGASLRMAIRNGFSRAMATIIDSHVTTLISAIVLYVIGSDQIKGFAVTLILGLLMSMYTAIFVARVIFDVAERKRLLTRLKMMHVIGETHIDFIRLCKPAIAGSIIIIVIGMVATYYRGKGLLDIDFTGGSSVQLLFKKDKPHDIAEVRRLVAELPDVAVSGVGERRLEYKVDTSEPNIEEVKRQLQQIFGDSLQTYSMTYGDLQRIEATQSNAATSGASAGRTSGDQTPPADQAQPNRTSVPKQPSGTTQPSQPPSRRGAAAPPASNRRARPELAAMGQLALNGTDSALAALILAQATQSAPSTPAAPSANAPSPTTAPSSTAPASSASQPRANAARPASPGPATSGSRPTAKSGAPAASTTSGPAGTSTTVPGGAGPQTTSDATTAGDESSLVGGSRVELHFGERISYESLRDMIERQLAQEKLSGVYFELRNKHYKEGSDIPYQDWTLEIALPPDQLQPVIKDIQGRLVTTPVFPSSNQIGGKVAGDMQFKALWALLASCLGIVIYIWVRFQNVIFGLAAVIALVHDVLVTVAFLAVSAYIATPLHFMLVDQFKISLSVVAALLTIVGYSINDTIVVFDRIREVRGKSPDLTEGMINASVNQTLSRTLLTSGTVFIASIILYIVGGQGIHAFAYSMVIGVIAGTYSSVYIAAPVLLWMRRRSATPPGRRPAEPVTTRG